MKVLHCPTMVGGNPQGLCKAEREIGLDSWSVSFYQNYLNYSVDEVIFKGSSFLRNECRRWALIFRMLGKYDVIHYNYGTFLSPDKINAGTGDRLKGLKKLFDWLFAVRLEGIDIKAARLLNKVIAVTYQGDDARQGDYCRNNYPVHFVHEVEADYYTPETDEIKRKRILIFQKYADLIYALNPDLLNVLPEGSQFLPYASVDPRVWTPHFVNDMPHVPHLVHAPSHRLAKGTRFLVSAVERLKAEGVRFHFSLVEGLSNAEAKKIYEKADIVVDQLLAGWYGGLAVEMMALGKPVISYLNESDMHYLPNGMYNDIPIINANPSSIYSVLKDWLTVHKSKLNARGMMGRAYVEKWHDPVKIATKVKSDYIAVSQRKKTRDTY